MKTIKFRGVEYINAQDLSEYLGITYKTIYTKLNANEVKHIFLGKSKYYELSECDKLIQFYQLRNQIKK